MNHHPSSGLRDHLLASTPFVVLFALIPASLYLHSGEDWSFDPHLLFMIAGAGLVLYAGTALGLRLLARRHPRAARGTAIALFCLGLFVLLAHVYAPIQIGPLDGSVPVSTEPVLYSLVELVLLVLLAGVFLLLARGRGLAVAGLFAGLVLAVGAGYLASLALSGERGLPIGEIRAADLPAPQGNVYHIVLDMMNTEALVSTMDRLDLRDEFRGFDLFRNNISNYINTLPSSASYFSGTFYTSGAYDDWLEAWRENGLFATVAKHGYTTWMYVPFPHWRDAGVDNFYYTIDIYEQAAGVENARFYDFAQIWLASLAPNVLTNEALAAAGTVRTAVLEDLAGTRLLSLAEGVEPYASMLMLRRLRADEDRRPEAGHYVYAHAVLPHGPEVLDGDCRYVGRKRHKRPRTEIRRDFLAQAECALTLVGDLLARLKELGRYDPATIVLHADTGHWTAFPVDDAADPPMTVGIPNVHLASWVRAPLMIKRPYADHPLRLHATPTQLVDLFPTLVDVLDLEPPDYPLHGRSVCGPRADEPREARFGFDPNKPYGPNIVEFRIDDPTRPASSAITVIGPATDRDLWRAEVRAQSITGEGC